MTDSSTFEDFNPFAEIAERKAKLAQQHENLRASKEYQDQAKYLERMTRDFLKTTQMCWITASRSEEFVDNSFFFRSIDDINQSVIAVLTLIEQGMLAPARREMRYILESSVKNLYVDQKTRSSYFDDKVIFLHEQVPPSSISIVDDLVLPLSDENKVLFIADLKGIYSRACAYVHPSKAQIDERVRLAIVEVYIGFERPKDLERINKDLFRLYEATLVLVFSALGTGFLGDIFIHWLDDYQNWRFHKGKYMKAISSMFDYKVERKERKSTSEYINPKAA